MACRTWSALRWPPPKAPPATAGRLPPAEGTPAEEPEPSTEPRLAPTPKAPGDASRAPELPSGPKEKWLVKKERSRDRKRSGKDRRARSRDRRRSQVPQQASPRRALPLSGRPHRKGHYASRSSAKRDAGECQIGGCPRRRVPGTVCCCHICFESGGRRHTKSCDGRRWAGTGSTDPPGPPGSGGGGGDDGKGDGPKKKKNRPSQKQRKRLAAQREAANRGADEEAGPPAEVKQEDPDYSGEELEELGGLARRVAVKASEAYARGTLASVRSRLTAPPGEGRRGQARPPAWVPHPGGSPKDSGLPVPPEVQECGPVRIGTRSTTRCTPAWRGLLAWPSGSVTRARGPGAGDSRWFSRHPGCRSPWPRGSACSRECGTSSEWGTWCSSLWRGGLRRP